MSAHNALSIISKQRSKIGAYQNRLEHTVLNESNAEEKLQAAEAGIRDSDMAKEIEDLAKHDFLEQIGNMILSRANHKNDDVLNLLK